MSSNLKEENEGKSNVLGNFWQNVYGMLWVLQLIIRCENKNTLDSIRGHAWPAPSYKCSCSARTTLWIVESHQEEACDTL